MTIRLYMTYSFTLITFIRGRIGISNLVSSLAETKIEGPALQGPFCYPLALSNLKGGPRVLINIEAYYTSFARQYSGEIIRLISLPRIPGPTFLSEFLPGFDINQYQFRVHSSCNILIFPYTRPSLKAYSLY